MKYTVSTYIFNTQKEAIKQIKEWGKKGILNKKTQLFEIKRIINVENE